MPKLISERLFPVPTSGKVTITDTGACNFEIECRGLDRSDHDLLMGFFNSMRGRFGEFQFDHAGRVYSKCRFDSDSVTFGPDGPRAYCVTLPIRILL